MGTDSPEVIRRPAKYIFLDVVQFSMRTAEDQSRIVHRLNSIVRESLGSHGIKEEDRILIPTGDGMCIALIGLHQYDVHVRFALSILKSLHNYNAATAKRARQFQIRIGINQNTDILVQDINNRTNIAGAGINDASRVMGQADGNQILVSRAVFDELQPTEKYLRSFRRLIAVVKHNRQLEVYQYVSQAHEGLNTDVPSAWVIRMPPVVAYYLAHAIQNRDFLLKHQNQGDVVVAIALLWLLANDSYGRSSSTETNPHVELAPKDLLSRIFGLNMSFSQRFFSFSRTDGNVAGVLIAMLQLVLEVLGQYQNYFEPGKFPPNFIFVNQLGKGKLIEEWPGIWAEFNLDQYT
jgi:class 3 adenylate cyclase